MPRFLPAVPVLFLAMAVSGAGCAEFDVAQPRVHGGPVLKAGDFGVSVTNTDNAAALNRALVEARRVKASRLDVPKGTYRCHGPVGIELEGLEDFVLDAHESLFLFWRKHPRDWNARKYDSASTAPEGAGACLTARNCVRVRIENLKSDWDWAVNPLGFLGRCAVIPRLLPVAACTISSFVTLFSDESSMYGIAVPSVFLLVCR